MFLFAKLVEKCNNIRTITQGKGDNRDIREPRRLKV